METGSRAFRDPVGKLRFLRHAIERYEALDARLQAVPGAPLRWLAYRMTGVEEVRLLQKPVGALDPPPRVRPPQHRRARRAVNAALLLVVAAAGLALASYPRSRPAPAAIPPAQALAPVADVLGSDAAGRRAGTDLDGRLRRGLRAVQQRAAHRHDLRGTRRRGATACSRWARDGTEAQTDPSGILYHTSESDIWPLDEANNEKLRVSSQSLSALPARRAASYHYLIDRFGRVFRVVEENAKANHAGKSVWSAAAASTST